MPSNTADGVLIGAFSLVLGFAGVWHITWLAVLALVAIVATLIARSFRDDHGYLIPAARVRDIETERAARRHRAHTPAPLELPESAEA